MMGLPVDHPELMSNFDDVPDMFSGDHRLDDAFKMDATAFISSTLSFSSPFPSLTAQTSPSATP